MNGALDMVGGFLMSPYGALAIVGSVFVVAMRKALAALVNKLTVTIHNKDINVSTQQSELAAKDISKTGEYEKIAGTLARLNIESADDLEAFLNEMYEELDSQDKTIDEAEQLTKLLLEMKENYEFAYLNLFLVPDSKRALLLFQESDPMTKDLFMTVFHPHHEQEDEEERELIFSTLLTNGLVEMAGNSLYQISDKGVRLLKYIQYI